MSFHDLVSLGWRPFFEGAMRQLALPDLFAARVAVEHRGRVHLLAERGPVVAIAPPPGPDPSALPHVGDWVLVHPPAGDELARLGPTLARRTSLIRGAAGRTSHAQVIVANIDVVFVVTSMNQEFNPRRIERYLAAVHASGAAPVIVLNKCDLAIGQDRRYTAQLPDHVPIVVCSAELELGMDDLRQHLGRGVTAGFVGSSGVGKSSLINRLLGKEAQRTEEIRDDDDEGRHTTTHRELFVLPGDVGVLVDTPGMRELQLTDAGGVDAVFEDLIALGGTCRFRDCGHTTEPGCAIVQGIADGEVDPARVSSWQKLQREGAWQERRRTVREQRQEHRRLSKLYKRVQAAKRQTRE